MGSRSRAIVWLVGVPLLVMAVLLPCPPPQAGAAEPAQAPRTAAPPFMINPWAGYTATIATPQGAIVIELDARAAPITVNNFIALAEQHFYDGLSFQRVVPGFLAQAGAPTADGTGGPGYTIPDENSPLTHALGNVAMAVSPTGPHSAGSQFYVTLNPRGLPAQDGHDTVFGTVTQGLEILAGLPRHDAANSDPSSGAALGIQGIGIEQHEREATRVPLPSAVPTPVFDKAPPFLLAPDTDYVATVQTERGDIVVQLNAGAAPLTVNNFVFLATNHFYDGLTCHRVIPGFVTQCGDPTGTGTGGPGYTIPDEGSPLGHAAGMIAMARTSQPNSAGSQFYITLAPQPELDGLDTVFGQVTVGREIAQALTPRDPVADPPPTSPGDRILTITIAAR